MSMNSFLFGTENCCRKRKALPPAMAPQDLLADLRYAEASRPPHAGHVRAHQLPPPVAHIATRSVPPCARVAGG